MTEPRQSLPPMIVALLEPGRYPHPAPDVTLVETHISWVLLSGDFAYKIKKPVDLGFLDFSSLAKRRYYCDEEVRLNQRLAPHLYLDVVSIGGTPDAPMFGAGTAMEYAVRMRRFPQHAQLDRMLAADALRAGHLDAFARLIAEFHASAPVAGSETAYGEHAAVYQPVEENFRALRDALSAPDVVERLDALETWCMAAFLANRDTHAARKLDGFVRECHGDLHLRNLAWIDGLPVAFDCIEFSPALRWIDVINEIAFLVMDLQARDQAPLAARFLNRYLERTGDYGGLALLPFYQTYRALVRAKVDAIRLHQEDITAEERRVAKAECGRYLCLGRALGQAKSPRLLITRGPSGSGKTTLTEPLVEGLGAVRIRSDVERKRLFGLPAERSARAAPDQGIYTAKAGRRTYARLLELAQTVLEAGYPVIVDAVFASSEQRAPFRALAADKGLPFHVLEFAASAGTLRERIAGRQAGASDADLDVLEKQLRSWGALAPEERTQAIHIDTERAMDPDALLAEICRTGKQ
jgi:aminoglycoside phosphotransferase family enzyme/predicted kinase